MKQEPIDAEWTDPKAGVLHPELGRRAYRLYVRVVGVVITVMLAIGAVLLALVPILKAAKQIP